MNTHWYTSIGLLVLLYFIFFVNTFHESYPDEFDNILGGKYILEGILPYTGFFTHHGPIAYAVSAAILLFSGISFVKFRILYSVFLFLCAIGGYYFLRKRFGRKSTVFYFLFLYVYAISATFFWGHMLLADSLSAILLAPVFAFLILTTHERYRIKRTDIIVISFLTGFSLLSSLAYVYLAGIIFAYTMYQYIKNNHKERSIKNYVLIIFIFAAPYLFYGIYLLVTGSLYTYYLQAIQFNERYYIYNYPRAPGVTTINPLRYAIVLVHSFYNNFHSVLIMLKDFDLVFPFRVSLAVANVCLFAYLLLRRYYMFAGVFVLMLIYANTRGNPFDSVETDYQSAVYIVFSFLAMCFTLIHFYKDIKGNIFNDPQKYIAVGLFLLLLVYSVAGQAFTFRSFFNKAYGKYMGTSPLIYDRPTIAPLVNFLTSPGEYVWIGPFEFEELFYTTAKPASKYHILIPGMGNSPFMVSDLLSEITEARPVVVWLNKEYTIFGKKPSQYGQPLIQYLEEEYVTVSGYGKEGRHYTSVVPVSKNRNIETQLYLRRDKASEMIHKLQAHNYIRAVEK